MSTLKKGSLGPEVVKLQKKINEAGYGPISEDGAFGVGTEKAVKRFQQSAGLTSDGIAGKNTIAALDKHQSVELPLSETKDPPDLLKIMEALEYDVQTNGDLNIVGVRSKNIESNKFDDEIHVMWLQNHLWQWRRYRCTTDPGLFWLQNPMKTVGTSILVPGQYPAYKLDLHRGKYLALCQRAAKVTVYRDRNRDSTLDWGSADIATGEGWFGINIHHAGNDSTRVDKWSAGCQVLARMADWNEFIAICQAHDSGVFVYTLLTQEQIDFRRSTV